MARVTLRGRAGEMTAVLSALRRVARTRCATILTLAGEPGIGKTSLLRDAAEQAERQGFAVGIGKTEEIDQIAPGAPLLVALRSGPRPLLDAGSFAELAPLQDRQLWLVDRIAEHLTELAGRRPVLIGLDDVQWADPLTRFALRILPSRLAALPVAWLLTSRLAPLGTLEEILAATDPAVTVTRVPLGPITEADIGSLAADRIGAAPDDATWRLLRGVGGNPFWAVQVLRGMARRRALQLPETDLHVDLLSGLRERLTGLPPLVVEIVRIAAVCGKTIDAGAVAGLLGETTETIIEAGIRGREEGLLTVGADGLSLPHDLIREAVYADILPAQRRRMHRARGRQLLGLDAPALTVAPHYLASAEPDDLEAVEVTLRAAAQSVALMPEQAARLARRAFGLLSAGHPRRLEFGEQALRVLADTQRNGDVLAFADVLLPLSPPEVVARIEVTAGQAMWESGGGGELVQRMDAALSRDGVPAAERVRLQALRALAVTRTDQAPDAARIARSVLADATRLDDFPARRTALLALTEATRNVGEHGRVLDWFDRLRAISPDAHVAERVRALQHLDRYDEAAGLLGEALRAVGGNQERLLPSYLFAQVWQHHNLGEIEAAESTARILLRQAEAVGNYAFVMNARIVLCALAVYRGDLPGARAALAPIERLAHTREILRAPRLRLTQAWLLGEEGDPQGALRIAGPLLAAADDGSHAWAWSPAWMRTFAGIARRAGDPDVAERAAWIAETGARRNPGVATMEAVALQVRGYLDGDAATLRKAVAVMRHSPRLLLLADTLRDLGDALVADGEPGDGHAASREAVEIYERLGGYGYARAVGGPGHRRAPAADRPAHGWAALTEAEARVAEIIVAGHTNRHAASVLGVSPNTVGTHLRSVFSKLEVRSRVQLANLARDRR